MDNYECCFVILKFKNKSHSVQDTIAGMLFKCLLNIDRSRIKLRVSLKYCRLSGASKPHQDLY